VLDQLDGATKRLMGRLPALVEVEEQPCRALFLDVSDTYFIGHGPELAEKGKTKEGLVQRKVGIVLLTNEQGYPLRWHVIAGKRADCFAMHDLIDEVRGLRWVDGCPLVCDRAMGATSDILKLQRSGVQFLTALRSTEFARYRAGGVDECLADLQPGPKPAEGETEPCVGEASARVLEAGMERVSESLYVMDLGVVEPDAVDLSEETSQALAEKNNTGTAESAESALRYARLITALVEQGKADRYAVAARQLGVPGFAVKRYRRLMRLDAAIQQDVLNGKASQLSAYQLRQVADLPVDEQRARFDAVLAGSRPRTSPKHAQTTMLPFDSAEPSAPLRVRAVLSFNPELFVEHRRTAANQLQGVHTYVGALNQKIARQPKRWTEQRILSEVDRELHRRGLLQAYQVQVEEKVDPDGVPCPQARLTLDPQDWSRRRRYDGFSLLVAHPALEHSAAALCQLYRDKDMVEKDFQVIKSVVRLRPVWHHTDQKVRAHVTLCMLALFLQRALDQRLPKCTAGQALETLSTCYLNRFETRSNESSYVVTEPDADQRSLLRRLKLEHLTSDDDLNGRLRPR
jgi:hypothetical protein